MDDTGTVFPHAEFEARCQRLQAGMAAQAIDALLLTCAADIFYATGFLTRFWESPARPWFVVVPVHGKPTAVIPSIGAAPLRRTWVTDIRCWDAPDPDDDGVGLLTEALAGVVATTGRIGLPMGLETHLRMPLADYARLVQALAPRAFCDASDVVQRVREVKSEAEIACLRKTCALAGAAFAQVPTIAEAGVPLSEVFRGFQGALLDAGADWVSYLAGAAGPDGYEDVISPASDRPLTRGDVLMLDTGAVRAGYFCDFDRNFSVGAPSDAVRRVQDALYAATDTALTELRPGMTACEAHGLLCDALRSQGAEPCGGRLGHGLGLTLTEWPSFTAKDTTVLRAGMALAIEPSAIVTPGRVLVHEENIVLRAEGAELLSPRAPMSLPELAA